MAVLRLVVDRRAALHDLLQFRRVEDLALARRAPDFFGQRERGAAVAVGHADERRARVGVERQRVALDLLGAREQLLDRRGIERLEHQHARARQQRRVQLERRVFGGGADQHDGAVLHHRQEAVLLRAVEAVDLVDEQQRPLPRSRGGARASSNTFFRSATPVKIAEICSKCEVGRLPPAAAPPWSCRCRAGPRRPASRASASRASASARRRGRAGDPGRPLRRVSAAAACRRAGAARPCRGRPRRTASARIVLARMAHPLNTAVIVWLPRRDDDAPAERLCASRARRSSSRGAADRLAVHRLR